MGFFPCERCSRAYRGKQQTIYPALLDGAEDPRMRRRLCSECFEAVMAWVTPSLQLVRVGDEAAEGADMDLIANSPCYSADCEGETKTAIFVTVYPMKAERHDYFGRSCVDHAEGARAALMATQLTMDAAPVPLGRHKTGAAPAA